MRARQPDRTGYAVNRGVRLYFELHGSGPLAVLLVPPWPVVTSAFWKMQLPFLARHYTVVLYDPRGNGRSDRPEHGYAIDDVVGDALAVLDELNIGSSALLTVSWGMLPACYLAARHPQRVSALLVVSGGPFSSQPPASPKEAEARRRRRLEHFDDWVRAFWARNFPEPHSTRAQDDGWEWTHETTAPILNAAARELSRWHAGEVSARIRCPVLLIHGLREDDHVETFEAFRALPQSTLLTVVSPGHLPNLRDPVRVNLILREFLDQLSAQGRRTGAQEEANARA